MALLNDAVIHEVTLLARQHYRDIGAVLGAPCEPEDSAMVDESLLHHDLKLLVGVANGEYDRTDELVRRVERALTDVMHVLFKNALHYKAIIPDDFWKTDIGLLVSRVRWWLSVDELITISNAAALAFGKNTQANRMRIARAIDNGLLEWVPDPSVINPQQNKRVLRPQVEHLRDQRQLPGA